MLKQRGESLAPYSDRTSENIAESIESLNAIPSQELSSEDKREAFDFANSLASGRLGEITCDADKSLVELYRSSASAYAQKFYTGYFDTAEGKTDLKELCLENASGSLITETLDNIDFVNASITSKRRKKIASNSRDWYVYKLADSISDDSAMQIDGAMRSTQAVNYDPEKLLDKLSDLRAYKHFYKQVRASLRADISSDLAQAKTFLLNIYAARTNYLIAELYPFVIDLRRQLLRDQTDTDRSRAWLERLDALIPEVIGNIALSLPESLDIDEDEVRLARRIDFLKHGVASDSRNIHSITASMETFEPEKDVFTEDMLSEEVVAQAEQTQWDADQLKIFLEEMLKKWSLLSEHQSDFDEVDRRDGPAPDNKWQIVITPKKLNLSVDGSKKVLFIPEKFNRLLLQASPAGALAVTSHELAHLVQAEYDYAIAKDLPIALVDVRRTGVLKEAGAVDQERKLLALFGKDRPVNIHYLKVLQVRADGGDELTASRVFYESYTRGKELTAEQDKDARTHSADRALRIFRHGGYNSQPLAYLEQELVLRELIKLSPEQVEAILMATTSFTLQELAGLHQFGLIDIPTSLPRHPAQEVAKLYQEKYLSL